MDAKSAENTDVRVTVWFCDECGYWRKDESTGVHQTTNPANPNGAMVRHPLRAVEFVPADSLARVTQENDDLKRDRAWALEHIEAAYEHMAPADRGAPSVQGLRDARAEIDLARVALASVADR